MMIDAGIKENLRQKLWAEAANMCVDLDNILVKNKQDQSPYEIFYKSKKDPDYVKNLRQFGEVGFVLKRGNKIRARLATVERKPSWLDRLGIVLEKCIECTIYGKTESLTQEM